MFGKWFGKDKNAPTRVLDKPEDLNIGDMLEMVDSFGLPKEIRGKTFQVVDINTYEYQRDTETEFLLQGPNDEPVYMTIENEDGERWANFTLKIERDEVEHLFDMDAFGSVFDDEVSDMEIAVVGDSEGYERWLADGYRQSGQWSRGYFHKADYRKRAISKYEDDRGHPFESVSLASDDDMHSVEIEVWEDGTTEVHLCVTRPVSDIKALYGKA